MVDDIDYEKEHGIKIPAPLDEHVASVQIRTKSNNPSDYFDLTLSASFGSEIVTLISGGYKISARMSINNAEIRINGVNCNINLISEPHNDRWSGNVREVHNSESSNGGGIDLALGGSKSGVDGSGKLALSHQQKTQKGNTRTLEKTERAWHVISDSLVRIGYEPKHDKPLMGRIIDDAEIGMRITPIDTTRQVGVLARLRVRENWINFTEVDGNLPKHFWLTINGKKKEAKHRRAMFEHLLAHLVSKELQDQQETRDATLSAAALVFSPVELRVHGQALPLRKSNLTIDPIAIENFIQTPIGEEKKYLQEIGAMEDESSDQTEIQTKFSEIWAENVGIFYWYALSREIEVLTSLFEASFGKRCQISIDDNDLIVEFSSEPCETLDGEKIQKMFINKYERIRSKYFFNSTDMSGFCVKGENAFEIAKLFGFPLGYQSFMNRVTSKSIKTGKGKLIPLHAILSLKEINQDYLNVFSGLKLKMRGGAYEFKSIRADEIF